MIGYVIFIIVNVLCLLGLIAFCVMFIVTVFQMVFAKDDDDHEYDEMMRKWRKYFYGGKKK